MTSIRVSNFCASAIFGVDQTRRRAPRARLRAAGRDRRLVSCSTCTANSRSTSPPGPSLTSRSPRRLVPLHLGRIFARRRRPSRSRGMRRMPSIIAPPDREPGGAEHRPRPAQRHMLPGPGLVALVALERVERDDEHALRAFGPKPRVDLVERPGGRRDAERRRDPAREPIEIIVGPSGLAPSDGARRRGVQIDDVEIGRVGQRAAAEPAKAENHQLAARDRPCALSNSRPPHRRARRARLRRPAHSRRRPRAGRGGGRSAGRRARSGAR